MFARRATSLLWVASAAAVASACGVDDSARVVVQGVRVDVELDPGISLCGGQLAVYDEFVAAAPRLLDLTIPDEFRVLVHAWSEDSLDEAPPLILDQGFTGAIRDGEAFIFGQRVDLHEIGHLVFTEVAGRTTTSLHEGLAETAASAISRESFLATPTTPLRDFLFERTPEFDDSDYFNAGLFVRYVIDAYGPESYLELHRSFSRMEDEADGRARFETVLGASIEEVDADFASQRRCGFQVPWCEDGASSQLLPVVVDEVLDCAASDTLGYTGPDVKQYAPYRVIPFDIDDGQRLSIVGSAARWGLRRCGDCSEQLMGWFTTAEVGETANLSAPLLSWAGGRYYVIIEAVDPDVPVEFRIDALP